MDQCIAFSISLIPEPSPRVNHDRIIFRLVRPALGGLETSFSQSMGPIPLGRFAFSPEGYVSVLLTNPDLGREAFKDGVPWRQATDTNIATVARLATSYSGPFRFSSDAGTPTLITKVEVTLDPNWIEQIKRGNSAFGKRAQKVLVLVPVKYVVLPASPSLLKRLGI